MLAHAFSALVALSTVALAQTNLVQNPGFEVDGAAAIVPGSQAPDWTASSPSTDGVSNEVVHTGSYAFSFGSPPSAPGTLTQSINNVVNGGCYLLTFYAQNEDPNPTQTNVGLSVQFGSLMTATGLAFEPAQQWVEFLYYTLGGVDTNLVFTGYNQNAYTDLDDVSLVLQDSQVPCLGPTAAAARTRRVKRKSHGRSQW